MPKIKRDKIDIKAFNQFSLTAFKNHNILYVDNLTSTFKF